jgi:hypothetical protein
MKLRLNTKIKWRDLSKKYYVPGEERCIPAGALIRLKTKAGADFTGSVYYRFHWPCGADYFELHGYSGQSHGFKADDVAWIEVLAKPSASDRDAIKAERRERDRRLVERFEQERQEKQRAREAKKQLAEKLRLDHEARKLLLEARRQERAEDFAEVCRERVRETLRQDREARKLWRDALRQKRAEERIAATLRPSCV